MKIKIVICEILGIIYNLRNEFRVTKFIQKFKYFFMNIKSERNKKDIFTWIDEIIQNNVISFRELSPNNFNTSILDLLLYDNQ